MCVLSRVQLFVASQTVAHQAPLPTRLLLCPWNFPGQNTGVDCHFLLQGIFPPQGLNLVSCTDSTWTLFLYFNCLVWISQDSGRYPFSAPCLAPGTCEDGRNA